MTAALGRRLLAEGVGTALLVAVVVGSGIAAQQLSPGYTGLQLLENSLTTGPDARRRSDRSPSRRR